MARGRKTRRTTIARRSNRTTEKPLLETIKNLMNKMVGPRTRTKDGHLKGILVTKTGAFGVTHLLECLTENLVHHAVRGPNLAGKKSIGPKDLVESVKSFPKVKNFVLRITSNPDLLDPLTADSRSESSHARGVKRKRSRSRSSSSGGSRDRSRSLRSPVKKRRARTSGDERPAKEDLRPTRRNAAGRRMSTRRYRSRKAMKKLGGPLAAARRIKAAETASARLPEDDSLSDQEDRQDQENPEDQED